MKPFSDELTIQKLKIMRVTEKYPFHKKNFVVLFEFYHIVIKKI